MSYLIHKSATRGTANHGWLNAHHTFSFANYYNPERMRFGVLRVLNDDVIAGGKGFGEHPHDNMEIVTIPLAGELIHKDSMNNSAVIKNGDIQVMSAGTGLTHSEYNNQKEEELKLLQIWLFPKLKNVSPRYDQITLQHSDRHNCLQQILSPNHDDEGVWVYQDAWFHLADVDENIHLDYTIKKKGNGIYIFVISGNVDIDGHILTSRDGLAIQDVEKINIQSHASGTEILLMDVPMTL